MSAPQELKREDLVFSRFMVKGQKVNEDGRGCMVLHRPTQKVGTGEDPKEIYPVNMKTALSMLKKQLGIPETVKLDHCPTCNQRVYAGLPVNWKVNTSFSLNWEIGEVVVYENDEEPGQFHWEYMSADGSDSEADDEEVYLTLADACAAAHEHLKKMHAEKSDKKEGSDGDA